MASNSSSIFDLLTAELNLPIPLIYGRTRGVGNLIIQHEDSSKNRFAFSVLGEGPWQGISKLWLNRKIANHLDTTKFHFHPGYDGEIGAGMAATSTGGDQKVDAFFADLPGGTSPITASRAAMLALKLVPDPGAPSAAVDFLADFETMLCRIFDGSGVQLGFIYTENPAFWILDFLIRKFVLREAIANQPLTTAEKARFDFQSFFDAANYFAALPGAYPLTAGMLSHSGMGSFTAANCVDLNFFNTGWNTDAAVANAYVRVDLGVGVTKTFVSCAIHAFGSGNAGNYSVQYSDDAAAWTDAKTGFIPARSGSNVVTWTAAGAHRYWQVKLTNTPGAGPALCELEFAEANAAGVAVSGSRFAEGGVLFLDQSTTADAALEQMLLICRSFLKDEDGKFILTPDKARASVFTFRLGNIQEGSFRAEKTVRGPKNRITARYSDINLAAADVEGESRFLSASIVGDHEPHQRAIGARGPGLSVIPRVQELILNFGNNSAQRVDRLVRFQLIRNLGSLAESQDLYVAPFKYALIAYEDSLKVVPGDVVTIDPSISEEHGGKTFEVLEIEERPDGSREILGLEYIADSFVDDERSQQVSESTTPGTGVPVVVGAGSFSYRTLKNVLRAQDAGSNVTIYVEDPDTAGAFVNRVAGVGDLSITAGSITAQSYSALVHVYYTDTGNPLTGGAKTFGTAATKEEALNGFGRFYLGSIVTPAAGQPDRRGNNDGGGGAQMGTHVRRTATTEDTNGSLTGSGNAKDGDWSTKASTRTPSAGYGDISNAYTMVRLYGFGSPDDVGRYYKNVKLTVKAYAYVYNENDPTGASSLKVRYSTNNGVAWTDIRSATATGSNATATLVLQTDVASLSDGIDLSKVMVEVRATGHTGGTVDDGILLSELYEATLEADI